MYSIAWLVLFIILLVLELMTLGLTTVWFAGGAFVAFIASLFHANLTVQLVLFVIVSTLLLLLVRPFASKCINNRTQKTNVEGLIGKSARVTSAIDNAMGTGSAILNGQEWMARSLSDEKIPEGVIVTVEEIKGVKLIVKKKEDVKDV